MNESRETRTIWETTGEFAQRDLHVVAKVKVVNERVEQVSFASPDPRVAACAQQLAVWLAEKSLSSALRVGVEDCSEFCADRESRNVVAVMLEAFHRSLEETLD